jgi:hypothetical protein
VKYSNFIAKTQQEYFTGIIQFHQPKGYPLKCENAVELRVNMMLIPSHDGAVAGFV